MALPTSVVDVTSDPPYGKTGEVLTQTMIEDWLGNLYALLGTDGSGADKRNLLTNGGFDINQRGGTITANNAYAHDRWQILLGGTSTITITNETTTIDTNSAAALKAVYVQGSANSQIDQKLEDYKQLRGQKLAFSIRVRQGVASNARPYINDSGSKTYGVASATTGSFVTLTGTLTVGASASSLSVGVDLGASDTVYLDNAMLIIGPTPLPYTPVPLVDDRARCERYYEQLVGGTGSEIVSLTQATSTTAATTAWRFRTAKAVAATVTITNPTSFSLYTSTLSGPNACTGASSANASAYDVALNFTGSSGLAAGNASVLAINNTNAQIVAEANP